MTHASSQKSNGSNDLGSTFRFFPPIPYRTNFIRLKISSVSKEKMRQELMFEDHERSEVCGMILQCKIIIGRTASVEYSIA